MPKVTILVGIPLAGKSTYTKKFPKSDIISRDAIRLVFFGKDYQYTDKNEKKVTEISKMLFDESIKEKKDILIDNTHCRESYVNDAIKMVPSEWEIEVRFFEIPLWKAYIRNVWRWIWKGKYIPIGVIRNMKKNFDKIDRKKYEMV